MTVDELMTMLEQCHHKSEVLLCINKQTYQIEKLASIIGEIHTFNETDDVLLLKPPETAPLNKQALKLCLGDLD